MTIFPSPSLGRSPFLKTAFNYIAVSRDQFSVGGVARWEPDFRVSKDGLRWRKLKTRGDILEARTYSSSGLFRPAKLVTFKGQLVIVGSLSTQSPFTSRAAAFVRNPSGEWVRATLSNDLINPTASGIVDAAVTDDYFLAVGQNGVLHYWDGVASWQSRTDLPMGATPTISRNASGMTATPGGAIVVVGNYTNSDGSFGAIRLISATSVASPFVARSIPSMESLGLAARGNVFLAVGPTSPNGLQRISAATLSDIATWSAAGLAVTGALEYLTYNGSKWIAGGGYNKQHFKSTAGSSGWSAIVDQALMPWGATPDERPVVNSIITARGKFLAHWGHYISPAVGGVCMSEDGENWQRLTSAEAGLAGVPYLLGSAL